MPQTTIFFKQPSRELMDRMPTTSRIAQEQPNTLITDPHCLVIYDEVHDDLYISPCHSFILRDASVEDRESIFARDFMKYVQGKNTK